MLHYELRQKGVASETIEEALDDYDELAAVRKVAQEQARRLQECYKRNVTISVLLETGTRLVGEDLTWPPDLH